MVVIFTSCEDFFSTTVSLDPPEFTPQLALTAIWNSTDTTLYTLVDGASDIFSGRTYNDFDTFGLAGVTVELYVDDSKVATLPNFEMSEPFGPVNEGLYSISLDTDIQSLGTKFELRASHPDYVAASAVQEIPTNVVPSNYRVIPNAGIDEYGYPLQGIELTIPDPAGESNFYEVGLFFKDSLFNPYDMSYDYYFNGTYNTSIDPGATQGPSFSNLFISDAGFDGKDHKLTIQYEEQGDTSNEIIVVFLSISEARYRFATSLRAAGDAEDFGPFSEPVSIATNVENGLGVFGMANVHLETIQL